MKLSIEFDERKLESIYEFCTHFDGFNPKKQTITECNRMAEGMKFMMRNPVLTEEEVAIYKRNPSFYAGQRIAFEVPDTESMQHAFESIRPVFEQVEEQLKPKYAAIQEQKKKLKEQQEAAKQN